MRKCFGGDTPTQDLFDSPYFQEIQHPVLFAIHPYMLWLMVAALILMGVMWVRASLELAESRNVAIATVTGFGSVFAYRLLDPALTGADRFHELSLLLVMVFGCLALAESFLWNWDIKPFRYIAGVALGTFLLGSYALPVWSFVWEHVL